MLKHRIKILATFSLLALVGAIINFAPGFSVNADGDELIKEIADYKTWTKVNEETIKVKNSFTIDGLSGGG
jgi:hypothetical protein